MLQKMRDGAQGTAAKIVVGLIIIALSFFGFGTIFGGGGEPAIATVNGEDITPSVLGMEVERQRQRILAQMGENANPDLIDPAMLQASVLDGLISRTLLLQGADDLGLAASDEEVDRYVTSSPQFLVDGQFDPTLFRSMLATMGHTPVSFREDF